MTVTRLGLIINPIAGLGGPLGQKGSDRLSSAALAASTKSRAADRCGRMLALLPHDIVLCGFSGPMAGDAIALAGLKFESTGSTGSETSAADTSRAAKSLLKAGVDLLVFVGGDGTARDICKALGSSSTPVLGLPAGVKMHSGVFATSPEAAAEVVVAMHEGRLVDIAEREVRDIDEAAFRENKVRTRHFGELLVPALGDFVQATKQAGREVEALAVADIAAEVVETLESGVVYLVGPGSTTAAIMAELGLPNTLLGADAFRDGQLLGTDLNAEQCLAMTKGAPSKIILTAIGGQGHLLGRGNQQFSPTLLRQIGRDNLIVVATKTKLKELDGRPLLLDSNDPMLDQAWSGFIRVVTGYRDEALVRLSYR